MGYRAEEATQVQVGRQYYVKRYPSSPATRIYVEQYDPMPAYSYAWVVGRAVRRDRARRNGTIWGRSHGMAIASIHEAKRQI